MRKSEKMFLKNKVLLNVFNYIMNGHTIEETKLETAKLCSCYFSNANNCLIFAFVEYVSDLQNLYYENMAIDDELRKYK